MANYVFIESRDPFESRDTGFLEATVLAVKDRGHDVTMFLVQNGVLATRKNARCLGRLVDAGVNLLADDLSLQERGIKTNELAPGIRQAGIDELVDRIAQKNTKAIWH
jgi:Predicted peroxiredoxins